MRTTIKSLEEKLKSADAFGLRMRTARDEENARFVQADKALDEVRDELKRANFNLSEYYRRDVMRLNTLLEYFICIANPVTAADVKRVSALQSAVTSGGMEDRDRAMRHFQPDTCIGRPGF